MKKLIYTLFFVLISVVANGQAKYVFYFIGDGMGVNQVNGTEMYQAEGVTGELGFVTEKISESDCEKKEAELGNVLQKIRVA